MIVIPAIRPASLTATQTDFGSTISVSTWMEIVNNINYIERSLPVGSIQIFYAQAVDSQGNSIASPNPDIWLPCDGRLVNDPQSPINGGNVPNMTNLFPKGSNSIGLTGGQETINLSHNHGGQTGVTDDGADVIADWGAGNPTGQPHYHPIDSRWSSNENVIPPFYSFQAYIRYK
ncbi:MAG: hypothetical protein K0U41_05430 [Gammaproteobacteria bacterium]|nr:hypothetical protein [Gammaproteobacteria bacterium]